MNDGIYSVWKENIPSLSHGQDYKKIYTRKQIYKSAGIHLQNLEEQKIVSASLLIFFGWI